MPAQFAVIPSRTSAYVALARTKSGKLYRKEILRVGKFTHATGPLDIDQAYLQKLKDNFDKGVCDIVQIPMVGDDNAHSEAPDRNLGEVVGLEIEGDKLFAIMDIRKAEAQDEMGKTLIGASAMFSRNYEDSDSGEKVGPTLLHVAVTNRPHITGLEGFQELVAASADSPDAVEVFTPSTETDPQEKTMTLEELIAALLKDHQIDVKALQAAAAASTEDKSPELVAALSKALPSDLVKLSAGETMDAEKIVAAVTKLVGDNSAMATSQVALSARVEKLEGDRIESEVDAKVKDGYILPAKRDAMVKLARQDHDLFVSLLPEQPIVKLSAEEGANPAATGALTDDEAATIERYANSVNTSNKK